ncbi:hypothetical protein K2Z83_20695 [Oscillochloris sp. ZM17-4]|uniref:hypothetical protein n=1 Tax=Oscillochloris sp. ZM17-4 TaxID=2866714 RepID=UPI001C733CE0|nr:hypothetical protein [Oscillochloris sp. ZM17-4]MBX0330090.1 hypothetical protein [Oscillochloris sp. ZM17-4]
MAKTLSHNRSLISQKASEIEQLDRMMAAAHGQLAEIKQARHHMKALLRWRKRTGADAGDPVGEMLDLIERINAGGWRLWRIDQASLAENPHGGASLLTLRDPQGGKLLLVFNPATITMISDEHQRLGHTHIGRMIEMAWQERCEDWHFVLFPTRKRGDAVIAAHGDIDSITPI